MLFVLFQKNTKRRSRTIEFHLIQQKRLTKDVIDKMFE